MRRSTVQGLPLQLGFPAETYTWLSCISIGSFLAVWIKLLQFCQLQRSAPHVQIWEQCYKTFLSIVYIFVIARGFVHAKLFQPWPYVIKLFCQ